MRRPDGGTRAKERIALGDRITTGPRPASLRLARRGGGVHSLLLLLVFLAAADARAAEEAILDLLPIRPVNMDLVLHSVLRPHAENLISVQGGVTVLRYGNVETRGMYRYYQLQSPDESFREHVLLVNVRYNNFLDLLDFPSDRPISRLLRHAIFGPLEDRAVPYVGVLGGPILPIAHRTTGYWYGGHVGVRFPVAVGLSLDMSIEYSRFGGDFVGQDRNVSQWILTTGLVF